MRPDATGGGKRGAGDGGRESENAAGRSAGMKDLGQPSRNRTRKWAEEEECRHRHRRGADRQPASDQGAAAHGGRGCAGTAEVKR